MGYKGSCVSHCLRQGLGEKQVIVYVGRGRPGCDGTWVFRAGGGQASLDMLADLENLAGGLVKYVSTQITEHYLNYARELRWFYDS